METVTKETPLPRRRITTRKIIGYGGVVGLAGLSTLWWLAHNPTPEPSTQVVRSTTLIAKPPSAADGRTGELAPDASGSQREAVIAGEAQAITAEQQRLFDELWTKLHDPKLRSTLTVKQLTATPGLGTLPMALSQRLFDEAMAMLARGELDQTVFWGRSSGQVGVPQKPVVVTAEQRQALETIKARLRDPDFTQSLTAAKLLDMQEIRNLPAPLRQELTAEVMGMLTRGELDQSRFLAASATSGAATNKTNAAAPDTPDTGLGEAATTHEQWRIYQDFRARLHTPGFSTGGSLEQLLANDELQTLPAHLRRQLETEVIELVKRGQLNLKEK